MSGFGKNGFVPLLRLYMSILNGGMMATHTLKYKIDQPSVQLMLGCAANQVIEEQGEMIKTAFSEIEITIDIDDAWGICHVTHVNGYEVKN